MKFLDIKTDFAFKKVFGSEDSKERLISFLNAVLRFNDNAKIKDLVIVDPYNIPQLKGMKDTYVDVKAVLDNDTKVIIEMQVLNCPAFEKRVLYNAAKNYSTQLLQGDYYHLLNPIIALTITDFVMFDDTDNVISTFKLLEKDHFINYSDDLEMVFIELPKFTKQAEELTDIKDQWIYFIKNAASLAVIPENISSLVTSAFEVSNTAGLSPEELEIQHKKKDFIYMQKASLELAESKGIAKGEAKGMEKGIAEGMEKGMAEGEAKGKVEGIIQGKIYMAKALLNKGVSLEIISETAGLSKTELAKLFELPEK